MPMYRIKPGHSFKLPDGTVKTGGDEIELGDDIAAQHSHTVDPVAPEASPAEPEQQA